MMMIFERLMLMIHEIDDVREIGAGLMVSGIWIVDTRETDNDMREIDADIREIDDTREIVEGCAMMMEREERQEQQTNVVVAIFRSLLLLLASSSSPRLLHPTDGDAPSPLMEHDPVALQQRKAYSGTSEHQVSIVVDDPFDGDGVSAAMQRSLLEDEKPLQLVRHRHRLDPAALPLTPSPLVPDALIVQWKRMHFVFCIIPFGHDSVLLTDKQVRGVRIS